MEAPAAAWQQVTAAALCVAYAALATLFSAAETAVGAVRRPRLQQLQEEGIPSVHVLYQLMEHSTGLVATAQLIVTASMVAATTLLVGVFGPPFGEQLHSPGGALLLLMALALVVWLVLVVQVGRALGMRHAEAVALGMAPVVRANITFLAPFVLALTSLGNALTGRAGVASRDTAGAVTEAGIILQVDVAEEAGVLEEDEGEMIRSIFEFGDTVAREIMVPRIDMTAAEARQSLAQVVDQAIAAGHSRIPIYKESVDHITGIFYVKDALRFLRDKRTDIKVGEVMRPAYFVPETKKLDELLHEMQTRRVHVAIVVDEYGGTAGLVTIEDILEEIVGEIQDEFDPEEVRLFHINDRESVVDAQLTLDDVNDMLSLALEADDVDTLGGFVYAKLGRVPTKGDEVVADGAQLIVEDVEGNRINRIRVVRLAPTNGTAAEKRSDAHTG